MGAGAAGSPRPLGTRGWWRVNPPPGVGCDDGPESIHHLRLRRPRRRRGPRAPSRGARKPGPIQPTRPHDGCDDGPGWRLPTRPGTPERPRETQMNSHQSRSDPGWRRSPCDDGGPGWTPSMRPPRPRAGHPRSRRGCRDLNRGRSSPRPGAPIRGWSSPGTWLPRSPGPLEAGGSARRGSRAGAVVSFPWLRLRSYLLPCCPRWCLGRRYRGRPRCRCEVRSFGCSLLMTHASGRAERASPAREWVPWARRPALSTGVYA